MKTMFALIAGLILSANVAQAQYTAQVKLKMDEALRVKCRGVVDKANVELYFLENTGDKGEPYGTGRWLQFLILSDADKKELGAEGASILSQPVEGNALFTTTREAREITMFVSENPAQKFAEISIAKETDSDVAINAIPVNNAHWGSFHCYSK